MPQNELAGTRIRARRVALGQRQSSLAQSVGISPAYLNLIEHNRRRIGGALLVRLAYALGVDSAELARGAQTELVGTVAEAVQDMPDMGLDPSAAGRFAAEAPEWARLVAAQHRRLLEQDRALDVLTDRMTHDPELAASMHEILSVVTAIRSTAAILVGDDEVKGEWLARFQRNIYEDSQRLAESAKGLVSYLDDASDAATESSNVMLPQEAFDNWFAERGFRLSEYEHANPPEVDEFVDAQAIASVVDRGRLMRFVSRYAREAAALPLDRLAGALGKGMPDPLHAARKLGLPFALVLRRMACLETESAAEFGLVECDTSGTITLRKPVDGFAMPRFGAACPLWPLFQCLAQPGMPKRRVVRQGGLAERSFAAFSVAEPVDDPGYDGAQVFQATMLLVPMELGAMHETGEGVLLGSSCRVCVSRDCAYRREPSVVSTGG